MRLPTISHFLCIRELRTQGKTMITSRWKIAFWEVNYPSLRKKASFICLTNFVIDWVSVEGVVFWVTFLSYLYAGRLAMSNCGCWWTWHNCTNCSTEIAEWNRSGCVRGPRCHGMMATGSRLNCNASANCQGRQHCTNSAYKLHKNCW